MSKYTKKPTQAELVKQAKQAKEDQRNKSAHRKVFMGCDKADTYL